MKARELGNMALHLTVGLTLTLAACWNFWLLVPVTFVYAFLREQAQHRYILGEPYTFHPPVEGSTQDRYYRIEKRTFFDFSWMTFHRMWEVMQWTLGSAIGCGIWQLFLSWEILVD